MVAAGTPEKLSPMLKRIVFLAVVSMMVPSAMPQLFVEANGTFLMPVGGYDLEEYNERGGVTTVTSSRFNAGRGIGGGLSVGGGLGQVLGWEARFSYIQGPETVLSSVGETDMTSSSESYQARHFRFDPGLRFSTGAKPVQAYAVVGPSIGFANRLLYTEVGSERFIAPGGGVFSDYWTYTATITGGVSIGAFGAVGCLWQADGSPWGFFAELQFSGRSWSPRMGEWTEEGVEWTPSSGPMPYAESGTIDFVDEYIEEEDDAQPIYSLPMSTWGLRAGVRFSL
jgi:hypothetical protein